jgi:hypothetical protein
MSVGTIPAGTTVLMSTARGFGPLLGGGVQVYVLDSTVGAIAR